MKNYLSDNLTKYIDKLKKKNDFKSDRKALNYLIEQIAQIGNGIEISDRAVRKWLNGEALPDTEKLCILADIMNVTVDELLKDKIDKIRDNNVPNWYEGLNSVSKQVLLKCLEPYKTGEFSKTKDRKKVNALVAKFNANKSVIYDDKFFTACDCTKNEFLEYLNGQYDIANTIDFYFKIDGDREELKIYKGEYYDHNQIVSKEIEKHKKYFQPIRLAKYFKNKDFNTVDSDEIFKVIDFGYVENMEEFDNVVYLYGEENKCFDENVGYEDFAKDNLHENQLVYFVRDEDYYSSSYKHSDTPKQKQRIENVLKDNVLNVINIYFKELMEKEILSLRGEFKSRVEIYDGYDDYYGDSYIKLSFALKIDDEDIVKILTLGVRENIKLKIAEREVDIAKLREEAVEIAKNWGKLWRQIQENDK